MPTFATAVVEKRLFLNYYFDMSILTSQTDVGAQRKRLGRSALLSDLPVLSVRLIPFFLSLLSDVHVLLYIIVFCSVAFFAVFCTR